MEMDFKQLAQAIRVIAEEKNETLNILLLGMHSSGKSTLFRQSRFVIWSEWNHIRIPLLEYIS